jgi:hypothetical protein
MPCKSPNPALAVGFGSNLSQATRYFDGLLFEAISRIGETLAKAPGKRLPIDFFRSFAMTRLDTHGLSEDSISVWTGSGGKVFI